MAPGCVPEESVAVLGWRNNKLWSLLGCVCLGSWILPRIDGGDALGLRLHHGKGDLVVQESDFPREMHSPEHGM